MTSIALAEELLLLAYDDTSGKPTVSRIGLDLGMAAAVLVELALRGRITLSDGSIVPGAEPAPTGDPVADEALSRILADSPHTAGSWVQRLRHGLRDRVLAGLVGRGVIRETDETALEVITVHRYPVVDHGPEDDIRGRLADALTGQRQPDEHTAALAALVAAVRMEPTLGLAGPELAAAHRRLQEIAALAGFDGTIGLEASTVRPSVAYLMAALVQAIDTALGRAPA